MLGRFPTLAAVNRRQIIDDGGCILVPVIRQFAKAVRKFIREQVVSLSGRLADGTGIEPEHTFHDSQKRLDSLVGNDIFPRRKQREMPGKTEYVPRIDESAAFNAPVNVIVDFANPFDRLGEFRTVQMPVSRCDPPTDLAFETDRDGGNDGRLLPAGIGVSHLGKQQRQMPMLHLFRSVLCQFNVERLPDVAERLLSQLRFAMKSFGPCAFGFLQ